MKTARRGHRRAARRRGVRVLDALCRAGCIMMRVCISTLARRIAPGPGAPQALRRPARIRRELLSGSSPRKSASTCGARLPHDGRDDRGVDRSISSRRSTTGRLAGSISRRSSIAQMRRGRSHVRAATRALARAVLDATTLIPACRAAIEHAKPVELRLPIRNVNRTVARCSAINHKRWAAAAGDIRSASTSRAPGQSFGAFVPAHHLLPRRRRQRLLGQGSRAGKLIVYPPRASTFVAEGTS